MHRSVLFWVTAAYRANEPAVTGLAQDATPAQRLRKAVRGLANRWKRRFARGSEDLARYFAKAARDRSEASLKSILKRAGFAVQLNIKPVENDILQAAIAENVALIKSIPEQYFTQIEGMVMRSVQTGRDLKTLTDDLESQYRVTRRKATLIARDQNNKATAAMTRARQLDLGLDKAIWMHSHGGRVPRPTHLANDGKEYDVATGWYDPDEGKNIWPGVLINCRCVSRPIIPRAPRGR